MPRHVTLQAIELELNIADATLLADLTLPENAKGIIIFAHGSGSGRLSPRNRSVAHQLHEAGMATLLLDLLSVQEQDFDNVTGRLRFDIGMLSDRLVGASDWAIQDDRTSRLGIGLYGASTGAAAALVAAAQRPAFVQAVVSRGGRPDLAGHHLPQVQAPVLLIVGGQDQAVMELNQQAAEMLQAATHEIQIIPGATHLFEEPGTMEQVAKLTIQWFGKYITRR